MQLDNIVVLITALNVSDIHPSFHNTIILILMLSSEEDTGK